MAGEPAAAPVEENCVGEFRFYIDVQSFTFDVIVKDFQTAVADRDKSFLVAFPDDTDKAIVFVTKLSKQSQNLLLETRVIAR